MNTSPTLEFIPSLLLVVALTLFLYDSPLYSLRHGRELDARRSLLLYHTPKEAEERLREMSASIGRAPTAPSLKRLLADRASRNALAICTLLNFTVSFSGIMAVSFFGTLLLQVSGDFCARKNFFAVIKKF